ncbi:MAG: lipocalin family protein [Aquincola tertiaricarbonis]|uniref:lipocalin family protein n=1 Tax=Aquincola sp. J276 TaxID=2898432 RepID=UPI0021519C3B|nr:lipocalin family protein [Aquincola sp. J276]MCR5868761.1 lipocalin family protein [Aquincola sp. J276]
MKLPRSPSPFLPVRPPLRKRHIAAAGLVLGACVLLAACQSTPTRPPLAVAPSLDIDRYMGDWYVIAVIPTWPERNAYDAVERYERRPDGKIATTFTFRDGGHDEPLKTMRPVGTVLPGTGNAIWTMQFLWPFEADYRIMHIDPGYQEVVVGREKRDYVWIMSRQPSMPAADLERLTRLVAAQGYDVGKLRRVPQQPR